MYNHVRPQLCAIPRYSLLTWTWRPRRGFPLAKEILTQAAYVDDIVFGADTEEQLLLRKQAIIDLLRCGACELSKWTSNSSVALDSVRPVNRIGSVSFDPQDEHSVKVLGLHWNTEADNFGYYSSMHQISSTKCQVLSVIARLFDSIGAFGPMLLWAKCFMQLLWCDKLDWNDSLPTDLLSMWQQFCSELPSVFFFNFTASYQCYSTPRHSTGGIFRRVHQMICGHCIFAYCEQYRRHFGSFCHL